MKGNTTAQNLTKGVTVKGETTSAFGHVEDSMGGVIDNALTSGKWVNLETLLITLNTVQGDVTKRRRKPQNKDNVTMTAMKIRPHLQWLCRKGGLNRAIKVFGPSQGRFRHGIATHLATILLDEMKELEGL